MELDSWHKHDRDFSSLYQLPVDADRHSGVKYNFLCFVKVQQNAALFNNSYSDITLETFKLH